MATLAMACSGMTTCKAEGGAVELLSVAGGMRVMPREMHAPRLLSRMARLLPLPVAHYATVQLPLRNCHRRLLHGRARHGIAAAAPTMSSFFSRAEMKGFM